MKKKKLNNLGININNNNNVINNNNEKEIKEKSNENNNNEKSEEGGERNNYPLLEEFSFKEDKGTELNITPKFKSPVRAYQEKALNIMCSKGIARSGIIVLPCGAGKTLVGILAICTIKRNTLIICNNHVAVQQWYREINDWVNITVKDKLNEKEDKNNMENKKTNKNEEDNKNLKAKELFSGFYKKFTNDKLKENKLKMIIGIYLQKQKNDFNKFIKEYKDKNKKLLKSVRKL